MSFLSQKSQEFTYSGKLLNHTGLTICARSLQRTKFKSSSYSPCVTFDLPCIFQASLITLFGWFPCASPYLSVCLSLYFVCFFVFFLITCSCDSMLDYPISPCQTRANTLHDHVRWLIIAASLWMQENFHADILSTIKSKSVVLPEFARLVALKYTV